MAFIIVIVFTRLLIFCHPFNLKILYFTLFSFRLFVSSLLTMVHKDDIQENILSIAKKMFLTFGYEKTSMDKISKRAGISKSNLYNYFKSKDEIFYALTDNAAYHFQKVIGFFDENKFSPKFGETGFN